MDLPRSTYYYTSRDKTGKEREDTDLRDRIERLALRCPRYGYRRMTAQLKRDGLKVNHIRVLRIMRASYLPCRVKRKFGRTTNSNHDYRIYPILYQNTVPHGPNQVWVADITYIRLLTDFVYRSAEFTTKPGCDLGCLLKEGGGLVLITPDRCSVDMCSAEGGHHVTVAVQGMHPSLRSRRSVRGVGLCRNTGSRSACRVEVIPKTMLRPRVFSRSSNAKRCT
ncbi:MAG: IS3 family transposase [Candidatus Marinimicrobia bacterium]|nr:IS3 family transposase [Candidatus Neomarinimicrobiota bacterium]